MTKSKKKIIFLTTSLILTICLLGFMGVYALTTLKNSQINVGISYQPEYLVKVEMGIDGANSGTVNQTIEDSEYVEIYNSLNPVSNGMYIQSMSSDTIHINSQTLTPIGKNGDVYFRITSLKNENSGNKDLQCIIDCGSSTADSGKLVIDTPKILTIATGINATSGTVTSSSLGMIKINLNFHEPLLTELIFEVPALNVFERSSYNDVISKINGLNIIGKYDDDSQKILNLNTDYELNFNRTDGGESGNFTQPGIAGTITAIAISNNEIQKTINLNVQPYTVFEYASGTGPVYDNDNESDRYVHYIEMGEYPQSYAGTTSTISATQQGTYYVDNNDGSKKYALKGSNYYLVEPVRWIVIGVTNGVYEEEQGQHVLFTTGFQAENESSSSGLWLYNEKTNTFKYRTTTSDAWQKATEVLVLSEYGLLRSQYQVMDPVSSEYNHFSVSVINQVLNDENNANSLYNTMFTDNQRKKIIPKTMPITSYYRELNSTNHNDVEYNMFLLGSTRNYNGGWGLHGTDSYNLGTYFTPANSGSTQSNLVAKETAYSSGGTQKSPDRYSASYWWSRSGIFGSSITAGCVDSAGNVYDGSTDLPRALRPAFVLDIT